MNNVHLPQFEDQMGRNGRMLEVDAVAGFFFFSFFREKMSNFSLRSRAIGLSDFFGPRSKAVLSSEGFVWVPVLGSLRKLRNVGVLSYLF